MVRGLLLLLVGCDSLAASDYVGDPLFSLDGTFAATTNAPEDPLGGVALFWQDPTTPDGPGIAATTVPVALTFPASFHVDIPVPPPAEARFEMGGVTIAEAYVFVVETGARPIPRGGERGHAVIWASADVDAGTLAADYLGGPVTAGYHLRSFAAGTAGLAQTQMIQRCIDGGAIERACQARRAYQLGNVADSTRLAITVSPP